MQCNQAFCGNGFTNGPFYSCNNSSALQCNQSMYPDIVGEGEVTSVTLPDGTIQFFFMPTVKWWSPNATQCQPNAANSMFANTNFNTTLPHCNNNVGTWFIRSISNPFSSRLPQNTCSPPNQRSEVPRMYYNSDCNMNAASNGYQLKFHNDNWTSTTDLHYFFPSVRQREYVYKQPCKRTATIPIETEPTANNNTAYHHEVLCSKPCNCHVVPKPMSLMSLVEPKSPTKCNSGSDDSSCDYDCKKNHRRGREENNRRNKTKVVCACGSSDKIVTSDKSVITYADHGSGSTPVDGRETQTCDCEIETSKVVKKVASRNSGQKSFKADNVLQRCEVKKAETWEPVSLMSKRLMKGKSSENLIESSDREYNDGCSSTCSCYSG